MELHYYSLLKMNNNSLLKRYLNISMHLKWTESLWKTVRHFLKELKTELPYEPAISLLGIFPKKKEH